MCWLGLPGTGSHGTPCMSNVNFMFHRSFPGNRFTVQHLIVPIVMPINVSSIRSTVPSHNPIRLTASPFVCLAVLNGRYIAVSPNGTTGTMHCSPLMRSYANFPSSPIAYLDMSSPAHLINHAMTGESSATRCVSRRLVVVVCHTRGGDAMPLLFPVFDESRSRRGHYSLTPQRGCLLGTHFCRISCVAIWKFKMAGSWSNLNCNLMPL